MVANYLKSCGSPSRTRTCDHSINSRMLYQLSYRGSAPPRYSKISGDGKRVFAACAALMGRAPSVHARSVKVPAPADASRNEQGRPLCDRGRNAGHRADGAGGPGGRRGSGAAHQVARPDPHPLRSGRQRRRRLRRRAPARAARLRGRARAHGPARRIERRSGARRLAL